jgi:exopolysaccharide biosynthesis polyprenyl glycosylphosphotransferase
MEFITPDFQSTTSPSFLRSTIYRMLPKVARRRHWILFRVILLVLDLFMVLFAGWLAFFVRFELTLPFFRLEVVPSRPFYEGVSAILSLLIPIVFAAQGLYSRPNLLGGTHEYSLVLRGVTICLFMVVVVGFFERALITARGWLLLTWFFVFLFVAIGRFLMRRLVYFLRRHGLFMTPTLIVGANSEGLSLAHQLSGWPTSGLQVVGFVDEKLPSGTRLNNHSVLGSVADLETIIQQYNVKEMILATSAISSRERILEIFKRYGVADNVNIRLSSGLYEIITTGLTVREFASVPLVRVNRARLTGVDQVFKMLMDYALTLPAVILLLPFLGVIALLIRLDSPGPILHRRRVMGVNGRQFDAFKFRTMHTNGNELLAARPDLQAELAKNHKLKHDPRVTRIGAILRRTSLDEVLQLINVLRGEMSLVGPRMISPEEVEKYNQWGINLLTIRPGITGLWQVSGRSNITYEQRVQLDMYYIRNWSVWLDLQLLWQTIPAVIRGTGAY